jgi:SOS-response transcriptional repressor LexA
MNSPQLNATFKQKSNTPFNNALFSTRRISDMHEQMKRLYEAARELKGITGQSELARALNASPQTVKNWESRGVSKQGMIEAQRVIGCSADWIETGGGSMLLAASESSAIYNVEPAPDLHGRVPLISSVQAGDWSSIVDNFQPGEAEDWLFYPKKLGPKAFALRVSGISMEPKYQHGDIIFVDPDVPAEHGSNVVVRLDDENQATFKQLVVEDGRKYLRPLNPDWQPRMIPINGNATICGVAVGKWVHG